MLELEHITKSYKKSVFSNERIVVLDDVSLSIGAGETLGLIGSSGCGKTTLAKIAMRLTEPTSGKVIFDGRDITELRGAEMRKLRSKMQIMFQNPESALNPRMKIYDSIAEIMRLHHIYKRNSEEERARVKHLIDIVGLQEEHLSRVPSELSGGQVQRAVLARVLSLEPSFLIVDEPTSMLDVSVQAQILQILKDAQKHLGFACLFISHNIGVINAVCDKVAVMQNGKIIENELTEELMNNPKEEFAKTLIEKYREDYKFDFEERDKATCCLSAGI